MRKYLFSGILFLSGIVLFLLALGKSEILKVLESLKNFWSLNLLWVFLLILMGNVVGGFRWYVILKTKFQKISFWKTLWAKFVGFAFSYITPMVFMGGEPSRYLVLREEEKKNVGNDSGFIIVSIIVDKLIFLIASTTMFFVGLFFLIYYLQAGWLWILFFCLAACFVFIVLPIFLIKLKRNLKKNNKNIVEWIIEKLYLKKIKYFRQKDNSLKNIEEETVKFFSQKRNFFKILLLSFLEITFNLFAFWVIIRTIENYFIGPGKILAISTLLQLSYIFPAPAALGSLEVSQTYGFPMIGLLSSHGLAFTLILRGVNITIVIFGMVLFLWFELRLWKNKILEFLCSLIYDKKDQ